MAFLWFNEFLAGLIVCQNPVILSPIFFKNPLLLSRGKVLPFPNILRFLQMVIWTACWFRKLKLLLLFRWRILRIHLPFIRSCLRLLLFNPILMW